jgi:hypothetical protein
MLKSHLNATSPEHYDSDVALFGFNLNDNHLKISLENIKRKLFPIERVCIYLSDGRFIENVFLVYDFYFYYYEEENYYGHFREDFPNSPKINILDKFKFDIDDIVLIYSTNNQNSPETGLLSLFFSLKKYIAKEVLVKCKDLNEIPKHETEALIYERDFKNIK